jgi:hypothetical protein
MKAFGAAILDRKLLLLKLGLFDVGQPWAEKEPGNEKVNFILRICSRIGDGPVSLHGSV